MKRVGLRLAGALLALSMCFGASARAYVPVAYAPVPAQTGTKVAAPAFTTVLVALAVAFAAVYRATTKGTTAQALEHVNSVAQFDATR